MRRGRGLTNEDTELWNHVTRSVKPLKGRLQPVGKPAMLKPEPPPVPAAKPAYTKQEPISPPKPAPKPHPAVPGLERRERMALKRGHLAIEAKIDLHGMTQDRAHRALRAFLMRAQMSGFKVVLVVTGKGSSGAGVERGILRRMVPHWLSLPDLRPVVAGFEEATLRHGGEGALYVRLRRLRS